MDVQWFSLNKKGEHCEMISFAECLGSEFKSSSWSSDYNSRFAVGTYHSEDGIFKTRVRTRFLSPGITYTINLVFKFSYPEKVRRCQLISLKYNLQGETESSIAYLAYEKEDGWWTCELYQFTSDHRIVHLRILFHDFKRFLTIEIKGIEFQPLDKVEHKEGEKKPISDGDLDSDANWEDKLPADYEDIIKRSGYGVQWITKKEAYSNMCKGFFINEVFDRRIIWFSLDKNGKKCHMLSARDRLTPYSMSMVYLPESRFREAVQYDTWFFFLTYEVQSRLLSYETTYAVYLIYKLSEDTSRYEAPMRVEDYNLGSGYTNVGLYIYLVSPQTPVIKPKADQNTHNHPHKLLKECLPQQRNDGWMEVQLLEFESALTTELIPLRLKLTTSGDDMKEFRGLIIEGIEIRPI